MRILGVDPGLRTTGYGAIDVDARGGLRLVEAGVVAPRAGAALERRLGELHAGFASVVASLRPDAIAVEELWTAYKNPSTAVLMGHARGVLYLAADACGVRVRGLAHAYVKRALTGSGAAKKAQVKRVVMLRLAIATAIEPDDVSDALALAVALADREAAELRLARAGIA